VKIIERAQLTEEPDMLLLEMGSQKPILNEIHVQDVAAMSRYQS
jgi:hypothetical protein